MLAATVTLDGESQELQRRKIDTPRNTEVSESTNYNDNCLVLNTRERSAVHPTTSTKIERDLLPDQLHIYTTGRQHITTLIFKVDSKHLSGVVGHPTVAHHQMRLYVDSHDSEHMESAMGTIAAGAQTLGLGGRIYEIRRAIKMGTT
ncbi:hypothetical protein L5515_019412 [Caenorhabditis briggsae]|uniref:Uncharacterized protein n=1 Tax=Caenorhabditis briggsae TaxID=6238 RepID=A0AAE9FIY0_CAEBR|nr:hypothetical protein L5515_019412 [Caenorhabditis briggsae]